MNKISIVYEVLTKEGYNNFCRVTTTEELCEALNHIIQEINSEGNRLLEIIYIREVE